MTPQETQEAKAGLVGLHPRVRAAAQWALTRAAELGIPVTVTSAYRSMQEQQKLRTRWERGENPYPANRPGESSHNWGMGFDSSVPPQWQSAWNQIRSEAGFQIYPEKDKVHAEYPDWRAEVQGQEPPRSAAEAAARGTGATVALGMPGMPPMAFPQAVATASARTAIAPDPQEQVHDEFEQAGQVARSDRITVFESVAQKSLANESQIAEVQGDTVATPPPVVTPQEAPPVPVEELEDLGIPLDAGAAPAGLPQEAPKPPAGPMGPTEPKPSEPTGPIGPPGSFDEQGKIIHEPREITNVGADRLASPYSLEERKRLIEHEKAKIRREGLDPDATDREGRLIYWDRIANATLAPETQVQLQSHRLAPVPPANTPSGPVQDVSTFAEPLRDAENAYAAEVMYPITGSPALDEFDAAGMAASARRSFSPDLLQRVSKEFVDEDLVGPQESPPDEFELAGMLSGESSRGHFPEVELGFGQSVSRGVYSGLRRYAQIFGADPTPPTLDPRVQTSHVGEMLGEMFAATPAFFVASPIAGLAMKGLGLAGRLTPLSYHLTRSAFSGSALGVGKTPVGEHWSFGELARNMGEEAALWTAFDAGALVVTRRMAGMAQTGREIRGIRKQIKGGEQYIDPVLLQMEQALSPNAKTDVRAVANRVHNLWRHDMENGYAGFVARVANTEAFGATVLDDLDPSTLKKTMEQIKAALPEGYSAESHIRSDGRLRLLILDDAAVDGLSTAQRSSEVLHRFQQTGKLNEKLIVDMLQRGGADNGISVPLEVHVKNPETGAIEARYEFDFGTTTELQSRAIHITMPKDANPQELISALSHELVHDMLVTRFGNVPQTGLIRRLFEKPIPGAVGPLLRQTGKQQRYRGIVVEELVDPKVVGGKTVGSSYNYGQKKIFYSEKGLREAYGRYQAGDYRLHGIKPVGEFNTFDDFKRFAFEHERQHALLGRRSTGESKVAYENRINAAAKKALGRTQIKGGEATWYRELRAVQRSLHAQKLGSRKAAIAHIKANDLANKDYELLADFVELSVRDFGRVIANMNKKTIVKLLAWVQDESLTMKYILRDETVATEALLREYATLLGSKSDEIMSQTSKVGKTSLRKMAAEQRVNAEQARAQFKREGVYEGERAFLDGGQVVEVVKKFPKEGRTVIRMIDRVKGRYKTLEIDDVRLAYPLLQGNLKLGESAINIIDNVVKQGVPKTLGATIRDLRGGVGRAIWRTKDLYRFTGSRGALMEKIVAEKGDDFVAGLSDADVFIKYAGEQGRRGIMLDEEITLTIFADPTKSAMHYHDLAPELVTRVHGGLDEREFMLLAEDVIAEGLYQSGIPLREIERLADFAMRRKTFQLRDVIDEDFAVDAVDDIWDDVLEAVHYFDQAGSRSMRHGSGRVRMFPDGTYGIIVNEGEIPGGLIAARLESADEAVRFIHQMAPNPGAPNLSNGSPTPKSMATPLNPKGGAKQFKWGHTVESSMRGGSLDKASDVDRSRWERFLGGTESVGEGAKRVSKIIASSRTLFQEYEKRGMGPLWSGMWRKTQDAMNKIKTVMNEPNKAFGVKNKKTGEFHSSLSATKDYQRRIQRTVDVERRPLLTQLQHAIGQKQLVKLLNFSDDTKGAIEILEVAAKNGVDFRHRISHLAGGMDSAERYLANPESFIRAMEGELRGSVPSVNRNLANYVMKFRDQPQKMTVKDVLLGMGHTEEEASLMQGFSKLTAEGRDIDLFGISRYFSTGNLDRAAFIAKHKMSPHEVKLSDELRGYIEEAMRVDKKLTEAQITESTDIFLKSVLPEMKEFVSNGFDINHRTITKYFGDHKEFLHRRMMSGDLNIYVNDPGYLAWRTYRGKLMQEHWEPIKQGEVADAMGALARHRPKEGAPELGTSSVPYLNAKRYIEELEGIPHESFAQIEDALIGLFEKVHLTNYVEPTILRDMIQKLNMATYKAAIPFRPLLLIRNASEIYRIGGITGGKSLGYGIKYVMDPKTKKRAFDEAVRAGALKPDAPVFTVDPSARTALSSGGLQGLLGRRGEQVTGKLQHGFQMVDDFAEKGMTIYQRVDEYTRAISYHSMQHRIRSNMTLAKPGSWNEFIERSKLSTFDKTELKVFEDLWTSEGSNAAIEFASTTFADKSLFLYGNANHPIGWGSSYGVLFGQFGTWPVQYKDFLINGMTRGTGKDRLEFAAWNLVAPAILVKEGRDVGIDLDSWWGVSSLSYGGGPYASAFMDVIRARSGNDVERMMARASLRRLNPLIHPIPNTIVPVSFAANDILKVYTGEKAWHEMIVKGWDDDSQ